MATRKRDRFFAAFGAILFLVTSSALAVAVIISLVQQHNANKPSDGATTTPTKTTSTNSTSKEATKLEGTKLGNFTPVSSVSQLQAADLVAGTGPAAKSGDKLVVDYTGALAATGVIFQSSLDSGQTFPFTLGQGQVISGWDQGLVGAKAGGTRRLLIPASMGYGAQAQTGIPANSDLVFDVVVRSIN